MAEEQANQRPTLENFLAGRPLNCDMEQLALEVIGEEQAAELEEQLAADPFDPLRPLDDSDRKDLLRLIHEPGWQVFERVRLRYCAELEKAAMLLSQVDPLSNKDKIANGWAQVSIMRQVMAAERGVVMEEIAKLKPQKKEQGDE